MPILNGLDMCRRIRLEESKRNWPPIPIVSLSANTVNEGWIQAADAGFSHYCGKPVNFRDLGHIVLELTDPSVPHRFLKDRPMPKTLLRVMGLENVEDRDDDDEEEEEEED